MIKYVVLTILLFNFSQARAAIVAGTVTNQKGEILAFASITIKGSTEGISANNKGYFAVNLNEGTYTIICRHVGYERQERTIVIAGTNDVELNFILIEQQVSLSEIVVKAGDENPAYAIIRKAVKKRKQYSQENNSYQCEVYSKGTMSLRNYPKKFMGETVDFEDGDTSKKKMIFLSETVSKISVEKPNKTKIEVISSRVSGQSNGFGFAAASFISFYENNIQISKTLNPRGFISPVADNAFYFYRYKYEGFFSEEGKLVNRIKVIPKRKYEPCFSGYINIVEDDWSIHSLELMLTKESQMDFADTLRIEQLYQMKGHEQWIPQSQVLYPAVKFFGFDAYGVFGNVYKNFNAEPLFSKNEFGSTVLKYTEGSNKKSIAYWDSIRPLPLTAEEQKDYYKKDSLELRRKNPLYLDSLDRINNKIKLNDILLTGKTFQQQSKKQSFGFSPLLTSVQFNTAEGLVLDMPLNYQKQLHDRKRLQVVPHIRYGFSSRTFLGWATIRYRDGYKYFSEFSVSGGKRVFQMNNENPIEAYQNSIATLFYKNNFMKLYAADYAKLALNKSIGAGITLAAKAEFQNRLPLVNTTSYSWSNSTKLYKPNYPAEVVDEPFVPHQASIITIDMSFQPGAKYIEFPDRKINIGSRWPVLNFQYKKGIRNLFGSDVDYDYWQLSVRDNFNMKVAGEIQYHITTGGFVNSNRVEIPDMKHFAGNRLLSAGDYLTVFQLPLYYELSNTEKIHAAFFTEYHLNGFLTNKIPGLKQLNWHLVTGAAGIKLPQKSYAECHIGVENILRFFRVDVVAGFQNGVHPQYEIRIGSKVSIANSKD
ncbi:MAG: DUF5686 and carboxypeptidase regulatory-like domain-containing protein [Lacibacter sp.]